MAFLHCHNCHWSQDDFWTDIYHPCREDGNIHYHIRRLMEDANGGSLTDWHLVEMGRKFRCRDGRPFVEYREFLAHALEEVAACVRETRWFTFEQFKADSDKRCPMCGRKDLDID